MTGGDFLVLVPWALFAAGLAVVSVRLRRPRWLARRGPASPGGMPGVPGRVAVPPRGPAAGRAPGLARVMTEAAGTALAVATGLAAAGAFGIGVAVQHRQAQLAAGTGGARALGRLARQRLWLAGLDCLAAAGLRPAGASPWPIGPLALVAPVVAADLLFALPAGGPLGAAGRCAARDWAWLPAGRPRDGSPAFLAAGSRPPSGRAEAPAGHWAVLAFADDGRARRRGRSRLAGAVRAGTARARPRRPRRPGAVFGLTAAVTAEHRPGPLRRDGLGSGSSGHWQPWALLCARRHRPAAVHGGLPGQPAGRHPAGDGQRRAGERGADRGAGPRRAADRLPGRAGGPAERRPRRQWAASCCSAGPRWTPARPRAGRGAGRTSPGLHSGDMPATDQCGELRETHGGRRITVARVAGQGPAPGRAGRCGGRR